MNNKQEDYGGYVIEYVIVDNGRNQFVTLSEIYDSIKEVKAIIKEDSLVELDRREFIDGLLMITVEFPDKC